MRESPAQCGRFGRPGLVEKCLEVEKVSSYSMHEVSVDYYQPPL